MSEPGHLRAADADRQRIAEEIRDHYAAGRLTDEELDERVQAAYAARTHAELDALRGDLPRLPASPAQIQAELARRRSRLQRRLIQQAGGGLGAFLICVAVWAASSGHSHESFWPIWVLLAVLMPLLRGSWRVYGPAPELDRVQRDLERRERRERARRELRAGAVDAELERRGPGYREHRL